MMTLKDLAERDEVFNSIIDKINDSDMSDGSKDNMIGYMMFVKDIVPRVEIQDLIKTIRTNLNHMIESKHYVSECDDAIAVMAKSNSI